MWTKDIPDTNKHRKMKDKPKFIFGQIHKSKAQKLWASVEGSRREKRLWKTTRGELWWRTKLKLLGQWYAMQKKKRMYERSLIEGRNWENVFTLSLLLIFMPTAHFFCIPKKKRKEKGGRGGLSGITSPLTLFSILCILLTVFSPFSSGLHSNAVAAACQIYIFLSVCHKNVVCAWKASFSCYNNCTVTSTASMPIRPYLPGWHLVPCSRVILSTRLWPFTTTGSIFAQTGVSTVYRSFWPPDLLRWHLPVGQVE